LSRSIGGVIFPLAEHLRIQHFFFSLDFSVPLRQEKGIVNIKIGFAESLQQDKEIYPKP
jgi:hypothetical protein